MTEIRERLTRHGACSGALKWIALPGNEGNSPQELWETCPRGDWLMWLAYHESVDSRLMTRAACDCARLALPYVPDGENRPRLCIETAEAYTRGEATMELVRAAVLADLAALHPRYAIDVYAAFADDATTYAARAAFSAAAYICVFDSSDVVIDHTIADAPTNAAGAAECNAFAARPTTLAAASYLGVIARKKILAECADLIRVHIDWNLVETAIKLKRTTEP